MIITVIREGETEVFDSSPHCGDKVFSLVINSSHSLADIHLQSSNLRVGFEIKVVAFPDIHQSSDDLLIEENSDVIASLCSNRNLSFNHNFSLLKEKEEEEIDRENGRVKGMREEWESVPKRTFVDMLSMMYSQLLQFLKYKVEVASKLPSSKVFFSSVLFNYGIEEKDEWMRRREDGVQILNRKGERRKNEGKDLGFHFLRDR